MRAERPDMDTVKARLAGAGRPGVKLRVRGAWSARLMLWYLDRSIRLHALMSNVWWRFDMPTELAERRLIRALERVRVEQRVEHGAPWVTVASGWDHMRAVR